MQYLGGKSRVAKEIASVINLVSGDTNFVSLFCGACSVESLVKAETITLNDSHPYLIALLRGVQDGSVYLPENVSKEIYYWIKSNPDFDPALTGFVGFGCSFGAKWWGGYAQNKAGTNYAAQAKRSLLKKMETLKEATIHNLDYRLVFIPEDSVVYCDPPYKNTTGYSNSDKFNHEEFWQYVRDMSRYNTVFVSELTAPEDFTAIWKKDINRILDKNKTNNFSSQECLFVYDPDKKVGIVEL
jgi:DNA adenine methylase